MSLLSTLQGYLAGGAVGGAGGGKSNPLPAIPDGRVDWGQNESYQGRNTLVPPIGGGAFEGGLIGARPPQMKATVASQNPYPVGTEAHDMYNADATNKLR